ncbi:TRAF-interacting protein [Nephila pilipes]|uniref:TRAF-interacting protein n=1 Tax=Nephila pilipes TaxID=299642 RepID=A0A8X6TYW0_NEPPI|nr:TRAF-interacting protein [Nephila pilipes]
MRCVICTDLFDTGIGIVSTQCGHVFHSKCLFKWIDRSKTCPECRGPVSSKNVSKLYFSFAPDDDLNTAHLENDMCTLKAKLREKDMELESSRKKIEELRLHAANFEKILHIMHQKEFELQVELYDTKQNLKDLANLETKLQKLKQ